MSSRNPARGKGVLRGVVFAIVAFSWGAAGASADTVFSNQSSFLAALGVTPNLQSFESLTVAGFAATNSIALPGFTMTSNTAGSLDLHNSNVLGAFATDGVNFVRWTAAAGGATLTFTFATPINAFGFTLTDALDGGSRPVMAMVTNGGASFPAILTGQASGTANFIGLIATNSFTQITFQINNSVADGIGVDAIYWGFQPPLPPTNVPEPATLSLLGIGLGVFAFVRRKV